MDASIPLISVLIGVKNGMEKFNLTMESLAAQSLDRSLFEVLICNDGSTDNTRERIKMGTKGNLYTGPRKCLGPRIGEIAPRLEKKCKGQIFCARRCWRHLRTRPLGVPTGIFGKKSRSRFGLQHDPSYASRRQDCWSPFLASNQRNSASASPQEKFYRSWKHYDAKGSLRCHGRLRPVF